MKSELMTSRAPLIGFVLGLAGAVLDFSSGYIFLSLTTTTVESTGVKMTDYNSAAFVWGTGLSVLGCILVITAVANVSSMGRPRMGVFGILMVGYGAIMLLIGGVMYSGLTPLMMERSLLSSLGMIIVGILMAVNGLLMTRTHTMM